MEVPRRHAPLVLVVDDFDDAREMYAESLAADRYRVMTAATGEEAYAQARRECPDIILLDLRMPGLSGTQTLHLLRSDPALARVPIVALTAYAFDTDRERALADGFDAFIPKPCLPDDLAKAIEQVLATRVSR